MTYTLKGGSVLTDEMIEEMVERFEAGELPGSTSRVIVAPPGRPRLSDEELVTVAFKVPESMRDGIDRKASSEGKSRSEFLRALVAGVL